MLQQQLQRQWVVLAALSSTVVVGVVVAALHGAPALMREQKTLLERNGGKSTVENLTRPGAP